MTKILPGTYTHSRYNIYISTCLLLCHQSCSLVAQTVINLPAMQETRVGSLCWEDPLEKEMVTHSSVLACEIPGTEEPGGL